MDFSMNLDDYVNRMKKFLKEDTEKMEKLSINEQKEMAFQELYDAGLITKDGKLREEYK